jgi:predicted transcriptional regulator
MPAITIEVDDATYSRLQRRAEQTQSTVEQVVVDATAAKVKQDIPDDEFDRIATRLIDTYRPVLKRLAE